MLAPARTSAFTSIPSKSLSPVDTGPQVKVSMSVPEPLTYRALRVSPHRSSLRVGAPVTVTTRSNRTLNVSVASSPWAVIS